MSGRRELGVWFPTVRTGTGTEVFTKCLAEELSKRGIQNEITWLPLRAEYAPWTVAIPKPPAWATVAHVNTWLHPRFLPKHLPVVATIHHSIHDPALRPYKGLARALYHRWWIALNERRVLRRSDCVAAVSQFVADTAEQTLCDVPMKVIYNGVDTERYSLGKSTYKQGEPFRLLYVGGWKALKGVDLLAPTMRELGKGFELRFTGGPAADRDRIDMPVNARDLGRLSSHEVIAEMQGANAFLFPSRSEGLPLVVIEAMACGLPVIAARGSSLAEVVEDGVTGILCPVDDVHAFAEAVRSLAQDGIKYRHARFRARAEAVSKFAIDGMVVKYLGLYAALDCGTKDGQRTSVELFRN